MSAYTYKPSLARRLYLTDDYGVSLFGVVLGILAGVAVVVAIGLVIGIASSRAVGRTTCRNFSTQTGFQTKFVVLNFFASGTCLAKAPNGQWVPNNRIYQFIQETRK